MRKRIMIDSKAMLKKYLNEYAPGGTLESNFIRDNKNFELISEIFESHLAYVSYEALNHHQEIDFLEYIRDFLQKFLLGLTAKPTARLYKSQKQLNDVRAKVATLIHELVLNDMDQTIFEYADPPWNLARALEVSKSGNLGDNLELKFDEIFSLVKLLKKYQHDLDQRIRERASPNKRRVTKKYRLIYDRSLALAAVLNALVGYVDIKTILSILEVIELEYLQKHGIATHALQKQVSRCLKDPPIPLTITLRLT
jgi:hypothetical protein